MTEAMCARTAHELAASFINGNRFYVVNELARICAASHVDGMLVLSELQLVLGQTEAESLNRALRHNLWRPV